MSAGRIVAALLLPPLGVYLARGGGGHFLIACGLTLLGFVPGVIFALWTVLRFDPAIGEPSTSAA
ncbi:YqaE/Pmp3 family membrane protein [Sphingomonas cannabina]|uniref:YqaE/Pmp3 family membrane protein n=1 Tax=Sphingomonas cannabina TaxID=2899123 RepID=UPI001F376E04|nr:YqaE/Pmp3 family membrane protein [Sphingomonas cannabina]UIJ45189.1 YqaE/Pmp3 family membrane protein [Sphingomonas cannabina]